MITAPNVLFGLSDAGAHCGDLRRTPTTTSSLVVVEPGPSVTASRSRSSGSCTVTRSATPATSAGWIGGGRPGYVADLNVIELESLACHPPTIVVDLPAGGRRLMQTAEGYRHTIKSGVVTFQRRGAHRRAARRAVPGTRPTPTRPRPLFQLLWCEIQANARISHQNGMGVSRSRGVRGVGGGAPIGGSPSAHAVHPDPGRRRRAQVQALDRVDHGSSDGTGRNRNWRRSATPLVDVAADVVGVVASNWGRSSCGGQHQVPEAGGELLDAPPSPRSCRRRSPTGRGSSPRGCACRPGPCRGRSSTAGPAAGTGPAEPAPTRRPPGAHLGEACRPGAPSRPGRSADRSTAPARRGPVDLEHARSVAIPLESATVGRRQPVAGDVDELAGVTSQMTARAGGRSSRLRTSP